MNLVAWGFFTIECLIFILPNLIPTLHAWWLVIVGYFLIYFGFTLIYGIMLPVEYIKFKRYYMEKYQKYSYSMEDNDFSSVFNDDDYEKI